MALKKVFSLVVVLGLFSACQQGSSTNTSQAGSSETSGDKSFVLATLDGQAITDADIEDLVAARLRQARMEMYAARKGGVDQIIDQKLFENEANKRGVSVDELQKKEISSQVVVGDEEIEAYYKQRKARFQGKSLDEVKGLIRGYLYQQKYREGRSKFIAGLRKKSDVKFNIQPPRVEVETGEHPSKGPEKAPVLIVEFSDYQCPFCGRARDTVNQIIKEYGKKVHYVFRDFPLSFHKEAQKAHEAAHCAREQGKYWEYNDRLFQSQRALKLDDLKKYAKELKLKLKEFDECLNSGKYAKLVQDSLRYGQSVGVSGTPAFFVNGRMVSGARPYSAFEEIIEDELSRN